MADRRPARGMAGYPAAPTSARAAGGGWDATPSRSWAALTQQQRAQWRRFQPAYLRDHPHCAIGYVDICTRDATTVDHLDGCDYRVDFLNPAWCRPACQPCHRRRTSQQGNAAQAQNPIEAARRAGYAPQHEKW